MPRSNSVTTLILKYLKKLKSLDGIDEIATMLGQILPGLTAAVVSFSVVTLALPLVYMGVLGMGEEFDEAVEEFDDILNSAEDTKTKLIKIAQCTARWREVIGRRLGIEIPAAPMPPLPAGEDSLENVARQLQEFETAQNKLFIAQYDKRFGNLGTMGMAGMTAGIATSASSSAVSIADAAGKVSPAVLALGQMLSMVSSAFFLGGQAAMFGFAASATVRGSATERLLDERKQRLLSPESQGIAPTNRHALLQITAKEREYNRVHSIEYGQYTMLGQLLMAVGTGLGFATVNPLVPIPFYGFGAPLTIVPAINRIVYEHKEGLFQGKKATAYAEAQIEKTALNVVDKLTAQDANKAFNHASDTLARMKLYSLLQHFINDRRYASYPPERKLAELQTVAITGNLSYSSQAGLPYAHGTALRGDILDRVKKLVEGNEAAITKLFSYEKKDANTALQASMIRSGTEENPPLFTLGGVVDKEKRKELLASLLSTEKYEEKEEPKLTALLAAKLKDKWKNNPAATVDDLARMKFYSYLQQVVNEARYSAYDGGQKLDALEKLSRIDKPTTLGKLYAVLSGSSKDEVRSKVSKLVADNKENIRKLLDAPNPNALLQVTMLEDRLVVDKAATREDVCRRLALLDAEALCDTLTEEELAALLARKLKGAWKGIRHDLYEKLVSITECLVVQQELKQEQNYVALIEIFSHTGEVTPEVAEKQKAALETFQKEGQAFIMGDAYEDKAGNMVYRWDDPLYKTDRDYSITYVIDNKTQQVTISYGKKASAVIAAEPSAAEKTGMKLIDIKAGAHKALGDENNKVIQAVQPEEKRTPKWTDNVLSYRRFEKSRHFATAATRQGYASAIAY